MVGTAITFGLVTWLHYSIYKDGTSAAAGASRTSSPSPAHSQTHRHNYRPPSGPPAPASSNLLLAAVAASP